MAKGRSPWLWLEPDAIPLKADWLDQLAREYQHRGKPFLGPIVQGRGHMNGVGIYPPDAALRCPRAMNAQHEAWDVVMRDEMIHDCHDASALIFQVWGMVGGKPHPCEEHSPTHFATWTNVQSWIPLKAVLAHRVKDGSLTKLLTKNHESKHPDRVVAARPAVA